MEIINQLVSYSNLADAKAVVYTLSKTSPQDFHRFNVNQLDSRFLKDNEPLKQLVFAFVNYQVALLSPYDLIGHFNTLSELVKYYNRYAETQKVWIIEPLIYLTRRLIYLATITDDYISKNPNTFTRSVGDFENESCMIKTSRIIHNSFKLCLNDRNEDIKTSRKSQIYYFVGLELKIYFKLQNRDLARNMEKVLASKKEDLPDINTIPKSHAITYLYYSGAIACGITEFKVAYSKFKKAFQLCSVNDYKHKEAILVYLFPLKFLITRKLLNFTIVEREFPIIKGLYFDLQLSLIRGDLKKFDLFVNSFENLFLKKNLYFVMENIRSFVLLKLVKRIYLANNSNHHLPIDLVTRGIEFAKFHTKVRELEFKAIDIFSSDETECLLTTLIFKGYMKGYLSHSNGVLVLSKLEPFPKQVINDEELDL